MKRQYACNNCDFSFETSLFWQEAKAKALCTRCNRRYELVASRPGQIRYGDNWQLWIDNPHIGEGYKERINQHAPLLPTEGPVRYALSTEKLHCIECDTSGSITLEPAPGTPCPNCHTGAILEISSVGEFQGT